MTGGLLGVLAVTWAVYGLGLTVAHRRHERAATSTDWNPWLAVAAVHRSTDRRGDHAPPTQSARWQTISKVAVVLAAACTSTAIGADSATIWAIDAALCNAVAAWFLLVVVAHRRPDAGRSSARTTVESVP